MFRTAIEAEILYQALYVLVQRLNTSLTKCQTRYCMEPRPSVDDCKVMRFVKRLSGKTPREQSSSGKKIEAVWCSGADRRSFEASAVLHFVFFEVIVNKMQQSAKESCLLKRKTVPEVFPLTIGSGKTMPFEKRHAGCEEREKINRRRIYDTLRINFFQATKQTACIFSKGDKNNPQDLRVHKHIFVGNSRLVTAMTHTDNNGDNAEQREKRYYYHSDHLGSTQFVTDWRGKQYEHIEYTPYGELWIEEVSAGLNKLPFRFTGKEMDEETGLYYYGARYLDPKYSRWLSGDPALGDYIPKAPIDDEAKKHNENLPGMGGVFNVVNLHLYHYAGNNPVKYTDPDGKIVIAPAVVWGINAILLMIGAHHVASSNKGDKLYQQIANGNTKEFSSTDLYHLYKSGKGKNVTLSQVGLSSKIQKAVASNPALTKNKGSVQSRFINQLKAGGASEKFERTYDFESVVFAIGGATVSGQFDGTVTKNENGTTHIEGTITYSFHDTFTDPYDTFNVTAGEFNPDGKSYEITETWTVKIIGDY